VCTWILILQLVNDQNYFLEYVFLSLEICCPLQVYVLRAGQAGSGLVHSKSCSFELQILHLEQCFPTFFFCMEEPLK
jgi:hypothetical protein